MIQKIAYSQSIIHLETLGTEAKLSMNLDATSPHSTGAASHTYLDLSTQEPDNFNLNTVYVLMFVSCRP